MHVKAMKHFQSTTLGNIEVGQVFDAPDSIARQMIASGYLELYETKVVVERPAMPTAPMSASQVGQTSRQTIATESEIDAKRRKKKSK